MGDARQLVEALIQGRATARTFEASQCCATVRGGSTCTRSAVAWRTGKPYCYAHDPERVHLSVPAAGDRRRRVKWVAETLRVAESPEGPQTFLAYHGTPEPFEGDFRPVRPGARINPHTQEIVRDAVGIYFSNTVEGTKNYRGDDTSVIPVRLTMQRPYYARNEYMALISPP